MLTRRQWMELTLGAGAAGTQWLRASGSVPRPSPELAVSLDFGGQLKLSSLRGRIVAVEFLLTGCSHCQHCSSVLQAMLEEFGPRGFAVLGAATNDNAQALIPNFVHSLGLKYPVGVAPLAAMIDYLQWDVARQGPPPMPQLVFVDRKGILRSHHPGDSDYFRSDLEQHLRAEIAALLAQPPAAGTKRAVPAKK
jgi:hypothetical protein